MITSKVINYLLDNPNLTLDEIKNKLRTNALYRIVNENKCVINEIEIPIILFKNFPQSELEALLLFIKDKLFEENYYCGIITQIDFETIKFMNYDIALLDYKSENLIDISDVSIIIAYDNANGFNVINGDGHYTITTNRINQKEIYESIIKILS